MVLSIMLSDAYNKKLSLSGYFVLVRADGVLAAALFRLICASLLLFSIIYETASHLGDALI